MYFGTFTNKYFKKIIEDACACEKMLQLTVDSKVEDNPPPFTQSTLFSDYAK